MKQNLSPAVIVIVIVVVLAIIGLVGWKVMAGKGGGGGEEPGKEGIKQNQNQMKADMQKGMQGQGMNKGPAQGMPGPSQ